MTLWDTHCHLADAVFDADRAATLDRARACGIAALVVVAADPPAWDAAEALVPGPKAPRLLWAAGLHPHAASLWDADLASRLRDRLAATGTVALGEIGLDYHYDHSPRPAQWRAFEAQLALAGERDLPVILHEREATADLLAIIRSTGLPRAGGVWHCFAGGPEVAEAALALGLHLGFGGLCTFSRGTEGVRAVAASCPEGRLLLETDAPYLSPVPLRGRRNEPAHLAAVLTHVAGLRAVDAGQLALATTANARRLFCRGAGEP